MSGTAVCPSCFKNIKENSKFCKFCGIPVKTCPKCKELNRIEDKFCSSCGGDISNVKTEAPINVSRTAPQPQPVIAEPKVVDGKQQQLVIWPPLDQQKLQKSPEVQKKSVIEDGPTYEPTSVRYAYEKVRAFGFFSGPLPTSNVLSATFESFGYALAFIAIGVVIASIGLAFFEYVIPPVLLGIIGGALLLSAPFFGIYYVSSSWLYKIFQIRRPVKISTVLLNYGLGTLLFSFLGLFMSPLLIMGGALWITFLVIAIIVYLMGLILIPLKAFLADLVYVKAAVNQKNREEEQQKESERKKKEEEEAARIEKEKKKKEAKSKTTTKRKTTKKTTKEK